MSADPLDSSNDDWTGDPVLDRLRLQSRAMEAMYAMNNLPEENSRLIRERREQEASRTRPHLLSEEELVRLEQGTPDHGEWLLGALGVGIVVLLIFICTVIW